MHSEVEKLTPEEALAMLKADAEVLRANPEPKITDKDLLANDLDRLASLIESLYRERDEAVALLAKVSRSLTGLTPGGSEYHSHSRDLDVYYADTEACERVIRDQFASGHKAKLEAVELRRAIAEQPQ